MIFIDIGKTDKSLHRKNNYEKNFMHNICTFIANTFEVLHFVWLEIVFQIQFFIVIFKT